MKIPIHLRINTDQTMITRPGGLPHYVGETGLSVLYLAHQGYGIEKICALLGDGATESNAQLAKAGIDIEDLPPLEWPGHVITKPDVAVGNQCLATLFARNVTANPHETALLVEEQGDPETSLRAVTNDELNCLARRISKRLVGDGVMKGDCIALEAIPSLEATAICLAAWQIGAIILPFRDTLGDEGLSSAVSLTRAKIGFTAKPRQHLDNRSLGIVTIALAGDAFEAWLEKGPKGEGECVLDPDHPASIAMTSGSTGDPKYIVLSHRCLYRRTEFAVSTDSDSKAQQHAAITDLTEAASFLTNVLLPLSGSGVPVILTPESRASSLAAWFAIARHRVTHFAVIPAILRTAVQLGADRLAELRLDALVSVVCGAGVLHENLRCKAEAVLPCAVQDRYGMNETAGAFALSRTGTISQTGAEAYNVLVRIVRAGGDPCPVGEQGHVRIFSDRLMLGQWNCSGLHAREPGWFATGDLATRNVDDTFVINGRSHDLIKSREGEFLSPVAIENIAQRHEAVDEAVVVPAPSADGIEEYALFIEAKEPKDDLSTQLMASIAEQFGQYAKPERILCLPQMPRAAHGKPDRTKLRSLLCKQ